MIGLTRPAPHRHFSFFGHLYVLAIGVPVLMRGEPSPTAAVLAGTMVVLYPIW